MFPLAGNWLASELTQKQFCNNHQMPAHILAYWVDTANPHLLNLLQTKKKLPLVRIVKSYSYKKRYFCHCFGKLSCRTVFPMFALTASQRFFSLQRLGICEKALLR